jgi:hypothetical protein
MATKIACANGNLTAGATWADVVTASTSLLDSESGTTTLTTAFVESQTFTPGAVTIDGIAVKVAGRATVASGTISVRLAQAGVLVAGTGVTINVSDIQRANNLVADLGNGWYFFKFAAPVLLVAATAYTVSALTSVASQVSLYRDATAANWNRMLRTTTTGAPAAGDNFFILGEWTAAATKTDRAVTMDSTAATDYGGASTTLASFGIGAGGTLTWGVVAATNYILRLSGIMRIYTGGTLTKGGVGTETPRDGTAETRWDCAADGDFGLEVWGTWREQGLSRTVSKNVVQCLMTVDKAIGQTVLSVDTDTGWKSTDEIVIASTSQTATDAEPKVLNGDAAAGSITISVATVAAHLGTSPNQAEIILLTRNSRHTAVTTTSGYYIQVNAGAVVDLDWVDFRYCGSAAASTKVGIYIAGAFTTFTMDFCCLRDGENSGVVAATGASGAIVINDTVAYNIGCGSASNDVFRIEGTSSCSIVLTRCGCIFDNNTSSGWTFLDVSSNSCLGFTVDTCRVSSGVGSAVSVTADLGYTVPKIIRSSIFHCLGTSSGIGVIHIVATNRLFGLLIDSCQLRRCPAGLFNALAALQLSGVTDVLVNNTTIVACTQGVCFFTSAFNVKFTNCTLAGDSSFAQTCGFVFAQGSSRFVGIRAENCTFGAGTAHSTSDIAEVNSSQRYMELTFVNCPLQSATEFGAGVLLATNYYGKSFISQHRKDGTTGIHQTNFIGLGTIAIDTTTFRTVAPSEKLTPIIGVLPSTFAGFRFRSSPRRYPVASGKKITFSVYVQKDATYNGLAPRLVLLANPAVGLDDDLVLDTHTVAFGNWEQLTGQMTLAAEEAGLMCAVVDCDGSAGNIYVTDWSAATT